ncbi:MAG: cupin domain-containing protein [Spirochaetales bacterium]|nr:cupin domain-containing protein [Spirochaetales bacterium]
METNINLKIKSLREQRELSIEKLAEMSGVSSEMIEKLEAGLLAPSLTPLLKIARGMGVRLGTFLDDSIQKDPVVVRGGKSDKVLRFSGDTDVSADGNLEFISLGAEKKDRHMEPFIVTVKPREAGEEKLSSHEGEEFIYVMDGEIELLYGKERVTLAAGDSLYYDSVVPHYLHAVGTEAKILAVLYTPA